MYKIISRLLVVVTALSPTSYSSEKVQAQSPTPYMDINITIDDKTLPVHLVDNSATRELVTALQQSPIAFETDDYGGFEKVGSLGRSLPTSNTQITTEAGDVILYSGNQIVLFYGSNSWSYTRLGRIKHQSLDELKAFLKAGQGRITVTLSLELADIRQVAADKKVGQKYAMNGTQMNQEPMKGVYIKDGKKVLK